MLWKASSNGRKRPANRRPSTHNRIRDKITIQMVYDTKTVLDRYKQIQHLPEGEADESSCPLVDGSPPIQTVGCEPGGCQTCCVGVVEIVRRYNEQHAEPEAAPVMIEDTCTAANRYSRE